MLQLTVIKMVMGKLFKMLFLHMNLSSEILNVTKTVFYRYEGGHQHEYIPSHGENVNLP